MITLLRYGLFFTLKVIFILTIDS